MVICRSSGQTTEENISPAPSHQLLREEKVLISVHSPWQNNSGLHLVQVLGQVVMLAEVAIEP